MCRALTVVCVAADRSSLATLKQATVAATWELAPGATDADEALAQIEERKAHVLVVWGAFDDLVERARLRFPALRIVAVGTEDLSEADASITSIQDVKQAILGGPPVGGPVRG